MPLTMTQAVPPQSAAAAAVPMRPLFLGGPPKSGTTLLQGLLDSHPQLLVFPEESRLMGYLGQTRLPILRGRRDMEWMLSSGGLANFGHGRVDWKSGNRDYRHIDFDSLAARARRLWAGSRRRAPDLLYTAILAYGEETNQIEGRRYWVEKTPFNEAILLRLRAYWPDLRSISLLRDPRDNYLSYARHRAGKPADREVSPAIFLAWWAEALANLLRACPQGGESLLIRYETLVADPRRTMRSVADFLGIDFDDGLLVPTKAGVPWRGNSVHDRDRPAGISDSSVGRFRDTMPKDLAAAFATVLGVACAGMGWWQPGPAWTADALPPALTGSGEERARAAKAVRDLNAVVAGHGGGLIAGCL